MDIGKAKNAFGMGKNIRNFYRKIETVPCAGMQTTASCALSGSA
jgi:hypothetical protein|tara:strand:- start:1505 stop:1636 length:132 start_codon:yes stop_codon:yes gene_type:complete